MQRKKAVHSGHKESLTKQYGQIGISAVAAATRYHGKAKNEAASRREDAAQSERADHKKIEKTERQ